MTVNPDIFECKFKQGQETLAALIQQLEESSVSTTTLKQGLEALSNALEEVHVLSEELAEQHSQLQIAQQSLSTERQQYFELFNLAPDGYIVTDCQGLIQQVNLTAAHLLNRDQGFLIGKPFSLLMAPTERQRLYQILHELRQGNTQQNIFLYLQPHQGDPFYASFTIAIVQDYQSQIVGFRWLFRDLTAQQQAAITLQESEQRYLNLATVLPVGIFRTNALDQVIYVNKRWCQISGLNLKLARDGWFQKLHPDDRERVTAEWKQATQQDRPFRAEFRFLQPDGTATWVYGQAIPDKDMKGAALGYVGSITDITDFKQAQDLIKQNSLHDPLTKLPNRRLLLERLALNINKANCASNYSYAVLFLDLDRFKTINDSLGHLVGDQLLIALARRLNTHIRKIDLVARLGGDEFVILLENISDTSSVVQIVERILADCQTPFSISGHEIFTSLSIGIVLSNSTYHQATDLIRDADIAMYQAKVQEHNSYKFFDDAMYAQSMKRLTLETELRKAIEQKELELYYQPIFELTEHRLVAIEALVRWQHPTRGIIPPSEFVPIAEESGLIVSLDRWVLGRACQQMVEWKHRFSNCFPLKISINLSAKDLSTSDLIEAIDHTLALTGLEGDSIILEITENVLIENIDQTINVLTQLASKQIQISIDDFGTGYSSLCHLHRLPVHTLKIDRTFVEQIQAENGQYKVVSTILALGKQLGLSVVAEGIETAQQLLQLQQLDCQLGQGYWFSQPLVAADIEPTFFDKAG